MQVSNLSESQGRALMMGFIGVLWNQRGGWGQDIHPRAWAHIIFGRSATIKVFIKRSLVDSLRHLTRSYLSLPTVAMIPYR